MAANFAHWHILSKDEYDAIKNISNEKIKL